MKLITPFDPTQIQSGVIHTLGVNNNEQLMLYNDSPIGMRLSFSDGSEAILPPQWNKDFIITNVPMGDVKWEFYNQLNIQNPPLSQCYGEIYEPDEHVNSVNASMQRNVIAAVPGGINLVSGTASKVQNDNSNAGDEILEATVSGDSAGPSAVITVDGNLTLGNANHSGSIDMPGGGATFSSLTVKDVVLQSQFTPVAGDVFSRIAFGNGITGATGSVVITHGLGVMPTSIVLNGYNSINNTWGVDTITTTQFTAHVGSGNSKTFAWIAIA